MSLFIPRELECHNIQIEVMHKTARGTKLIVVAVSVKHVMMNRNGDNNYLGASCSFMHDFYLNIVALKITWKNKTHGSEYEAEISEDRLKADYHFDLPRMQELPPATRRMLSPMWISISLKIRSKSTAKCTI